MKKLLFSTLMAGAFFTFMSCGGNSCYKCSQKVSVGIAETTTTFEFCEGDNEAEATVTVGSAESKQTIKTVGLEASDFEKQGYTCTKK